MKSDWVETLMWIYIIGCVIQYTKTHSDKAVLWPARAARELVEEYKK